MNDDFTNGSYNSDGSYNPEYTGGSKKKGFPWGKVIALMLVAALLGGALGAGGVLLLAPSGSGSSSQVLKGERPSSVIDVATIDTSKQLSPAEVYAQNVASTVGITTSVTTNYFGFTTTSAAAGSGFVLSDDGYILTNYHVIENSTSIKVTMYDGSSYEAELIGYDESNDIAVLKVDAENLSPVVLGDSDNLNVGDSVVAIGNPLGELTFSLTAGVVSALDREVTLSGNVTMELIQTDCAINSGNSGGALFNLYGEVIGITNAKYSSSGSGASIDNIGFAIPINSVMNIVESIIEKGYIAKPYIGVSVTSVSSETQSYGLPKGAAVKAISEDSPAEKAGLQINDIITEANGTAIESSDDLVRLVGDLYDGAELKLTVYRQGETVELTVIVGEKIQSALGSEEDQAQVQQQSSQRQFSFPGFFNFGY
ncbi:MAG: S1C family serine protease [Candidatus Limivicinus sp.]